MAIWRRILQNIQHRFGMNFGDLVCAVDSRAHVTKTMEHKLRDAGNFLAVSNNCGSSNRLVPQSLSRALGNLSSLRLLSFTQVVAGLVPHGKNRPYPSGVCFPRDLWPCEIIDQKQTFRKPRLYFTAILYNSDWRPLSCVKKRCKRGKLPEFP